MDLDKTLTPNECTKELAKSIQPIGKDTVHRICSGQVVLNLAIAVKELVENALDAGASSIEIRLKDYGQESVEVIDNGSGVESDNFSGLTLKYHTSKLREFSDLLGVSTYGFRGEALSSLCALSNLVIITRHSSVEYGSKIMYDNKGQIKETVPCAREVGTTVSLTNLFNTLPVRQKEFHRNIKREFNKMTQLLYAYCIVCEAVKFTCTNQTNNGNKTVVVATQGGSIRDNIACVFGVKQLQTILSLEPVYPENYVGNIKENFFSALESQTTENTFNPDEPLTMADELELSEESSNDAVELDTIKKSQTSIPTSNSKLPFNFHGYISSCAHGSGRSTSDRQFFYINSRPCEPHKLMKVVNEVYKQYNPHQYPFVFLDVKVKRSSVDVNVTPDKRKIFLDKEKQLLDILKGSLNKIYEHIPSMLKIENVNVEINTQKKSNSDISIQSTPRVFSSFLSQFASKLDHNGKNCKAEVKAVELKRKASSLDNFVSISKPSKPANTSHSLNDMNNDSVEVGQNCSSDEMEVDSNDSSDEVSVKGKNTTDGQITESVYLGFSNKVEFSQVVDINDVINVKDDNIIPAKKCKREIETSPKVETEKKIIIDDANKTQHSDRKVVNLNINIDQIRLLMLENIENNRIKKKNIDKVKFRVEINPIFNKKCEDELRKEISKDMFVQMKIIGQFNLGFIVTQLEDDLFIIDQHATDEKYNFEILQKTTILSNQKLVVPQTLDLTGVNERVLMDNLEICKNNGFTFDIDENAPPTKRVKLLTIPISNNYVFGKEDVEELLFMLKDSPQEVCRPSRVQSMFASRACRKSVMIGTALSKSIMRKLVDHMGLIEHPWNCPHGRPTIRHLVNVALVYSKSE